MKTNSEMSLFFWAMFINMVVSFLIGHLYKDFLISFLSPTIYYQFIVFLSLLIPYIIKYTNRKIRIYNLSNGIKKIKQEVDPEKQKKLDESTKAMYERLVNTDVTANERIRDLHEELEALTK